MKPVALPMLHLLMGGWFGVRQHGCRLARNIGLTAGAYPQPSLEFVRGHLDEAGRGIVPVVENPLRTRAAGQFQVTRDETANRLDILRLEQRFEVDAVEITSLFCEIRALIQHVCETAAHACRKISATGAQYEHQSVGHVFAPVVADTFDDGGSP